MIRIIASDEKLPYQWEIDEDFWNAFKHCWSNNRDQTDWLMQWWITYKWSRLCQLLVCAISICLNLGLGQKILKRNLDHELKNENYASMNFKYKHWDWCIDELLMIQALPISNSHHCNQSKLCTKLQYDHHIWKSHGSNRRWEKQADTQHKFVTYVTFKNLQGHCKRWDVILFELNANIFRFHLWICS